MPDTFYSSSVIVPTFNGAARIGNCLEALLKQTSNSNAEILVVDDGSTDHVADVVNAYAGVRLITQKNAGPAAARNRGAAEANAKIIVFTDDDCVPESNWLAEMLAAFQERDIAATKGAYRTKQRQLIARFVQLEYEDRYRRMERFANIDFVDTYSAAFRRDKFLELGGFDSLFPVACAEDADLSYRMSERGLKMKFTPNAIVCHSHPNTLSKYLKKKYKFAFWRVVALRKSPHKVIKDSHTPQLMKLQLIFLPALLLAASIDLVKTLPVHASLLVIAVFFCSTLPFAARAFARDPLVGLISPALLALRSIAQFFGVIVGTIYGNRHSRKISAKCAA